jgi:phage gpG-like protein
VADQIAVHGLRELRRTFRRTDPESVKALRDVQKEAAEIVATRARILVPVRTGALQRSIQSATRGDVALVRSRLPYAPVLEYGGTIKPRGVDITFERREFVGRAAEQTQIAVANRLARGFDRAMRRAGWK